MKFLRRNRTIDAVEPNVLPILTHGTDLVETLMNFKYVSAKISFLMISIFMGLAVFVGSSALGSSAVSAQQPSFGSPGERAVQSTMRLFDTDGDEMVGGSEIADEQKRIITAIDINGDGTVSVDEFRRNGRLLLALNVTTFFDMMDINGDGQLSVEEVTMPASRWVARYDADADGALSADELRAARLGISN